MATEQQIENAVRAGWDPGQPGDAGYPKEPPDGWDAHGTFIEGFEVAADPSQASTTQPPPEG